MKKEEIFYIKGFGDKKVRPMLHSLGYQLAISAMIDTSDFPYLWVDPSCKRVSGVTSDNLDRSKKMYNGWEDYANKEIPGYKIDLKVEKTIVPIQVDLTVFETVVSAEPLYKQSPKSLKEYLTRLVYQFIVEARTSLKFGERVDSAKIKFQMNSKTYVKLKNHFSYLEIGEPYALYDYMVELSTEESIQDDFVKFLVPKELNL